MKYIITLLIGTTVSMAFGANSNTDLSKSLRKEYNAEAKRTQQETPKPTTSTSSAKTSSFINCGTGVTILGIENTKNPYGQGITNSDCAREEHYSPNYFKRKTVQGKNYVKQYNIKKTNTPIKSGYERVRPDYNGVDDKPILDTPTNQDNGTFSGLYPYNPQ